MIRSRINLVAMFGCQIRFASTSSSSIQTQVLDDALDLVPEYGWTRACLGEWCCELVIEPSFNVFDCEQTEQSARNLGLSPLSHGIAPNGEVDLVGHFVRKCNAGLKERIKEEHDFDELTTRDRIKCVIRKRLEMTLPVQESWAEALGTLAVPHNLCVAGELMAETVDEILHQCGDESVDVYWYIKRGLISGVYGTSELFMLTDSHVDKLDTWKFVDQRVDDYATAIQQSSWITKLF